MSDAELRRRLGAGTTERGSAYARDGAVTALSRGDHGRLLLATVRGSGRSTYQTLVKADPGRGAAGGTSWSGRCSCPMTVDCKHVAAVVITARQRWGSGGQPVVPRWEAQLADLVRPRRAAEPGAGLGLQVEIVPPSRGSSPARLRLRPVVRGRTGRWVRTGVSWREIEHRYGHLPLQAGQVAALAALLSRFRARPGGYHAPYADAQVHLDDLGSAAWPLLAAVRDTGIELVGIDPAGGPVHLLDGAARVGVDLHRAGPDADTVLRLVVRLPDGTAVPTGRLLLVGEPAHGIAARGEGGLLLAALERPLDTGTHGFAAQAGDVRVPAADLGRFLTGYYPALRQRVDVGSSDGSVDLPEVHPPRLALAVRFAAGHRTRLQWSFTYRVGDDVVPVPLVAPRATTAQVVAVARDAEAEADLLAGLDLLDVLPALRVDAGARRAVVPEVLLTGLDTAVFVERLVPLLAARDDIDLDVQGEPVDYVQAQEPPLIAVSAGDPGESGADWFDLGVTVSVGGQQVPFGPLFAALSRDEEHLLLDSGTWFRLDRPELRSLHRLIEEARGLTDHEGERLTLTPFQAGLWEELVTLGVVAHQSERWSRTVGALLDLDRLPRPDPPAGLRARLRDYQLDGYHWLCLLWDHQLGGVLADDMGLGKTVQTLAMIARAHEAGGLSAAHGPVLIVAPTSVVATWVSEAARFCPRLTVVAVTETQARGGRAIGELAVGAQVVVTSYALLRLDEDAYRATSWSGLVLDEAQFVKNHQARTYQVARRLPAPFKLAITGTPLENSLMDLWSLLSITAPGLFPSPQRFTEHYRKPIESGQQPERLATLRRRIRPLMLRRTKEQVASDLPPKIEQTLVVTLNPRHRRVYDKHLQRERQRVLGLIDDVQRNRIAILRSLTVLRQLSLDASLVDAQYAGSVRSSKIDALVEQLGEVVAEGHRALVFSQFTGFLGLVRARLDAEGIGYAYLDGRTRDRPRRIREFTEGSAPVFLISLKAGGVGLTLTEADYVFVLDPWWNPATEAQAVDRTHRIGQDKTVMVYRLVAADTIEEKVVALQQRKRDLFERVVDEGALLGAQLSADDIRGLFAG